MTALVILGDTSGSVTLQAPAAAGSTVHTLPAATGTVMVSGNMPAFSASKQNATQSIPSATWTKITFDTEEFDTNNCFTSSRFTPTVAGYYQFTQNVEGTAGITGSTVIMFYKNGVYYTRGNQVQTSSLSPIINSSTLIYCNGSTDYVEVYIWCSTTMSIDNSNYGCRFTGAMVRAA